MIEATYACCHLPLFPPNHNPKEMMFQFDKKLIQSCKCSASKIEQKVYSLLHAIEENTTISIEQFDCYMYSLLFMIKVVISRGNQKKIPALFNDLFLHRKPCKYKDFIIAGKWCEDNGLCVAFLMDATLAFVDAWLKVSLTLAKSDPTQVSQMQCMLLFYKETVSEMSFYYAAMERACRIVKQKEDAQDAKACIEQCVDAMNITSFLLQTFATQAIEGKKKKRR
jgi:hypothetical protein